MQKYLLPPRQALTSVENIGPAAHPIAEKRRNIEQFRKVNKLKLEDSFSIANDEDELDLILTAISKIVVESVSTVQPDIAESILKLLRKAKNVRGNGGVDLKRNNGKLKCQPPGNNIATAEHKHSNDATISAGPSSARKRRASINSSSDAFDILNIGESTIESDSLPSSLIHCSSSADNIVKSISSVNKTSRSETPTKYESIICSSPTAILDGPQHGLLHWSVPDEKVEVLQQSSITADIDTTSLMGIEIESKSKRNIIKKKEKKKPTGIKANRRRSCLPSMAETYLLPSSDDIIVVTDINTNIEPATDKASPFEGNFDSKGPLQQETTQEFTFDLLPNDAPPVYPSSARKRRASMNGSPSSHLSEGLQHLSCGESITEVMAGRESLSSGLMHWSSSLETNVRADEETTCPLIEEPLEDCSETFIPQDDDVLMIHSQMFEGEDASYDEVGQGILHWDTGDVDNSSQPIMDSDFDSCLEVDSRPRRNVRDKKKEKRKPTGGKSTRRRSYLPPIVESHVLNTAGEDTAPETGLNESILSSRFAATSVEDDSFLGGILHWECSNDGSERTSKIAAPVYDYPVEPTPRVSSQEVVSTYDESINNDADVMKMLMEQEDLKSFPPSAISDMKVTASESRGRSRRRASLSAESFIKSLNTASHRGSPQATATLAALSAATAADLVAEGESEPSHIMARNKRRKKTKLLDNVVENLPFVSLEKELEGVRANVPAPPQDNSMSMSSEGGTIGVPAANTFLSSALIEQMLGAPMLSISSNILDRVEVEGDVVSKAESIVDKAISSSSSSSFLVNESSLLCIVVVALLAGVDSEQVESLVANLRVLCEVPLTDEKILQYSSIEKSFHSINSNGLTLSQSQSSSSKGLAAKKTVRFNAVDGSAIDPPNDRRPLSWISLLLEAKKVYLLSESIGRFLNRERDSSFTRKHDLSVLCAVLLFFSTEKYAEIIVRNVCKQGSRVSPNFVSSAELQTIAQFLLGEISLQLSKGTTAFSLEKGLRQSSTCLRKRSSWMLSAVVRYQLRWCLDLPPPCISVPSAPSRDGSAVTEDLYSTYRSRLHHIIEILQPLTEEALRAKPAYSVDETIRALNFPSGQRSQKAMAFLNSVKEFFCARPFANLSFLFAEALRQVSALLSLICSSCGGDAPLLCELAPLDCLCQLRVDSTTVASALARSIRAADKDSRFDICQTILGGEVAVNFLQNVFGSIPDLSLTCHSINSSSGSTLSQSSLPVNDVIIDTVQTLRELSSVCMEDESKESHLQLLRGGFEGLRSAIFPVHREQQQAYHILPKELIRLCNTELYSYLDSLSRSKTPIAEDVYCHSILIFPTILSRADISQTGGQESELKK
eukprot:gene32213-41755_t